MLEENPTQAHIVNKRLQVVLGLVVIVSIGLGAALQRGQGIETTHETLNALDSVDQVVQQQAWVETPSSDRATTQKRPNFLDEASQVAGSLGSTSKILPVDDAFPFDYWWKDGRLGLRWQVRDGYYLYRSRFTLTDPSGESISLPLPQGRLEEDPYFGDVYVLEAPIEIELTLRDSEKFKESDKKSQQVTSAHYEVAYQGCAKQGYCYPPQKRLISQDAEIL